MGWGRTLRLGDIGNRLDIADTERDIASLRSRLDTAQPAAGAQDSRNGLPGIALREGRSPRR